MCASPDLRLQVTRYQWECYSLFAYLLKWTLDAGEKPSERDPEMQWQINMRELRSKADFRTSEDGKGMVEKRFAPSWASSVSDLFACGLNSFGEGHHGQAPAEHFLFCVSFQCAPRSGESIFFQLERSSFAGRFLSFFFAFLRQDPPWGYFSHLWS